MTHDELAGKFAVAIVEGMDMETLTMYAIDSLRICYTALSPEQLQQDVKDFYPHLLDTAMSTEELYQELKDAYPHLLDTAE